MNDNQYNPVNYYPNTNQPVKSNNKFKFILIGLIAIVIVALIALFVLLINRDQSPLNPGREATAVLNLYANLPDETPMDEIEKTIKNIDNNAEITMEDSYGIIKIPGNEHEFISFYYDSESTEAEDLNNETTEIENSESNSLAEDEAFEDEWEGTYEVHQPNTAYNFIYIYEYPEDDYALYIAREYNDSTVSFQYFDGTDIFDFSSKQEAIDAYLAPTVK